MTIAAPPLSPRRRVPENRWSAPLQPDPDGRWPIHTHVTGSCPADGASRRRADTPAVGCSGNRRGQWAQWFVAPGWVLELAPVVLPLQRSEAPAVLVARLAFRPLAAWPVAWQAPVVSRAWAWGPQVWVPLPAQVAAAEVAEVAEVASVVQQAARVPLVPKARAVWAQRPSAWRSASVK